MSQNESDECSPSRSGDPLGGESSNSVESLAAKLNRETAIVSWSELVKHFARGVVIHVTAALDLVDAAERVARDDAEIVQCWLETGLIRRASDNDARDWTSRQPQFWCVVTAPWVLVQERLPDVNVGSEECVTVGKDGSPSLH